MKSIKVIDSHTAGEPTRVVPLGEIELRGDTMAERIADFRTRLDHLRRGILLEPRGSDIWVGAVLTPPIHPESTVGIIFVNNSGYIGMCGHGSIGVVETLRHLNQLSSGKVRLDTVAGTVTAELLPSGEVVIENVCSYRHLKDQTVEVEGFGLITGDVAYGGNWFFVVHHSPIPVSLKTESELRHFSLSIKQALATSGITGANGAEIDHIELSSPVEDGTAGSANYVLCPGDAYDRSPCGTGTSAKVSCLIADGVLAPGEWYVQQSVTGTQFRAKGEIVEGQIFPTIVGKAWVTAETCLLFSEDDPLRWGFE